MHDVISKHRSRQYNRIKNKHPPPFSLRNYELKRLYHEPRQRQVYQPASASNNLHINDLFRNPFDIFYERFYNPIFRMTTYDFNVEPRRASTSS